VLDKLSPFVLSFLALATPAGAQILALKEPSRSPTSASRTARGPTADTARAFALTFEDAVRRGARDEVEALFDHAALLERATKGIPATEKVKKSFREGARAAWEGGTGIISNSIATVAAGGTLRWLRLDVREGETTAVFRLTRADAAAPEYLELVLAPRGDKSAVAVDAWSSADGVTHARVLRRWLLALVADAGRTVPERIAGIDREFAHAGQTFEAVDQAFEAGRNADALSAWATLPETLRLDPAVVLARLRAALAAGGSTFEAALREVRAAGVTDACVDLLAVDAALAANAPERALSALERLVLGTTRDPYLAALRGSILRELRRDEEARAACRQAIASDPALEEAYWTLLGLAIENARHEEALQLLTSMDERFEVDWRGLAQTPAYAAFLESKPGSRWRARVASNR
jgi:Flp pilus assembly protein TadD